MVCLITTIAPSGKSDYKTEAELNFSLQTSLTDCAVHNITVLGAMSWQRGVTKILTTNSNSDFALDSILEL